MQIGRPESKQSDWGVGGKEGKGEPWKVRGKGRQNSGIKEVRNLFKKLRLGAPWCLLTASVRSTV